MSNQVLTSQAALIYAAPPVFEPDTILMSLNSAIVSMGHAPLTLSPMASDQFMQFSHPALHATIAIHRAPLGISGLERALNAARVARHAFGFQEVIENNPAHVIITIGEGASPLPFDTPDPVPARTKLEILFRLMRVITAEARPKAAHLCTSDRFYTPEELDKALTRNLPISLLVHPIEMRVDQNETGQTGTSVIAHQSEHLLDKTLVIEGLPPNVPKQLAEQLIESLIGKYLSTDLPLANGDKIRKDAEMTLHVRHSDPLRHCPNGAIIVSFWSAPPHDGYLVNQPHFEGHPGYMPLVRKPNTSEQPQDEEASDLGWTPTYMSAVSSETNPRKSAPPMWMILTGIGLFLWVGLPLLNVPQMLIESTLSNRLDVPLD